MDIKQANELFDQAFENLQKIQDELEVEFPETLPANINKDDFFTQLAFALNQIENCVYDLDQVKNHQEAP